MGGGPSLYGHWPLCLRGPRGREGSRGGDANRAPLQLDTRLPRVRSTLCIVRVYQAGAARGWRCPPWSWAPGNEKRPLPPTPPSSSFLLFFRYPSPLLLFPFPPPALWPLARPLVSGLASSQVAGRRRVPSPTIPSRISPSSAPLLPRSHFHSGASLGLGAQGLAHRVTLRSQDLRMAASAWATWQAPCRSRCPETCVLEDGSEGDAPWRRQCGAASEVLFELPLASPSTAWSHASS